MAKIGTAHVEIKPVLNEEALDNIAQVIERRVASAIISATEAKPQVAESFTADLKTGTIKINGRAFPFFVHENLTAENDGPLTVVHLGLLVDGFVRIGDEVTVVEKVTETRRVLPAD